MKRVILIVAALGSLVLAGCAHRFSIIEPARPQVFVSEGRIVVNQEPVIVKRASTILRSLPANSSRRCRQWLHETSIRSSKV